MGEVTYQRNLDQRGVQIMEELGSERALGAWLYEMIASAFRVDESKGEPRFMVQPTVYTNGHGAVVVDDDELGISMDVSLVHRRPGSLRCAYYVGQDDIQSFVVDALPGKSIVLLAEHLHWRGDVSAMLTTASGSNGLEVVIPSEWLAARTFSIQYSVGLSRTIDEDWLSAFLDRHTVFINEDGQRPSFGWRAEDAFRRPERDRDLELRLVVLPSGALRLLIQHRDWLADDYQTLDFKASQGGQAVLYREQLGVIGRS